MKLGTAYYDIDLVICTKFGCVIDPRNTLRTIKKYIRSSGVTVIRFHDMRHTHASILISSGVDIVKIANRLGHSNPRTTLEIYAHLIPNSHSYVAETFAEKLRGKQEDKFC
ncbi:tyrosine-type recombinase/integrase [Bacillus sp. FJAT-27245]|uniref:tyrosine-type recombinase/integrase n=1 Tax=Bacillus sp. FJAT-27245 TaxID=1684144 RepID=UPI0009E6D209|nr:tyrosine-type recombinase/integrase [Bacillus sp. FJAT-27245]